MSSICLSLVPNLRCQGLTWTQLGVLLIPPGLEVAFGLSLLLIVREPGSRKHYLLAGEGVIYFVLALLDLLSHVISTVRTSLTAFKAFDILIGALTTGPLLLYMSYLYLLSSREFIPRLPQNIQSVWKYATLLCIPVILVFNGLASFTNLSYRLITVSTTLSVIGVKFTQRELELFFNSLTLVLLVIFQALNFLACFFRLFQAIQNHRRIQETGNNDNEIHLFNGIGWMAAGIKLGAVESVIGFAAGDFGLTLTRRILRMLGRALLIVGIVKGLDLAEDFQFIKNRPRKVTRRSNLLLLISSPRPNSFRQMGGHDFESGTQAPAVMARSRPLSAIRASLSSFRLPTSDRPPSTQVAQITTEQRKSSWLPVPQSRFSFSEKSFGEPPHSASTTTVSDLKSPTPSPLTIVTKGLPSSPDQRVIVRYRHGRAPTLDLKRFSQLAIPQSLTHGESPLDKAADSPEQKARELPPGYEHDGALPTGLSQTFYSASATSAPKSTTDFKFPPVSFDKTRTRHTFAAPTREARSNSDGSSIAPSRKSTATQGSTLEVLHALTMQFPGIPPTPALPITPAVAPSIFSEETYVGGGEPLSRSQSARTVDSRTGLVRRSSSVKRKPVPRLEPDVPEEVTPAPTPAYASSRPYPAAPPTPISPVGPSRIAGRGRQNSMPQLPSRARVAQVSDDKRRNSTLEFPWVRENGDIVQQGEDELNEARKKSGLAQARIKSIGRAPRMLTPTPSYSSFTRQSVVAEWHDIRNKRDSVVFSGTAEP